ncbi:GL17381 [Drosophila persimilis]|uniref:GL17381 n=1 Tax=Drosophila persimilis TaxID=7234 RepID=B4GGN6_DROPE|nr:coilin [Drosophila persimilis]EDW35656.1 GL17381 [Drosophila persimilis]
MEAFTMKVNLTFFFSDERQNALILIDSTWQTIEDVQKHIQVLFNLKDIRLLTNSGYFLPPKESLRVLKDASGLKAFSFHEPPATSLEEGSKKTSKKRKKSFDETESLRCSPPWDQPKRSKQKNKSTLQPISLSAAADDKVNPSCNTSESDGPLSNSTLNQPKRFKQKNKSASQSINLSAAADDKVKPSCNTSEAEEPLSNNTLNQPKRFKQKKQSTLQAITQNAAADDKVNPSCNTSEAEEPLSNSTLNQPKRFKQKKQSTLQPIPLNAAADDKVNPSCNTSEDVELLSNASLNQRKRSNKSTLQPISSNAAADDKAETNETTMPMPQYNSECDQSSSDDDDNRKAEVIRQDPPVHNSFMAEYQISSSSLQITSTLPRPSELQEPDLTAKENSTLLVPEPRPISFRCPLMELDSNKVRTYNISIKSKPAQDIPRKYQKKQTDSSEHIKLATPKTAKHESTTIAGAGATTEAVAPLVDVKTVPRRVCADAIDCDSEDDVMVLDDTSVDVDSDVEVSPQDVPSNDSQANDSSMVMFKNASPLKDLPKRGDTILFKLRKIKKSMGSGLTGVIAASCTYINRRTKAVSLQVISSPPGISPVLKQYCNSLDDSCEDIPCLMVNMIDLIEAKRVVPRA